MNAKIFIQLFLFLNLVQVTFGISWLSLHRASSNTTWRHKRECRNSRKVYGFNRLQARICRKQLDLMPPVASAAFAVTSTCVKLFRNSRWNCSSLIKGKSKYGSDLTAGTREQAVVYSLSSAALVWTLSKACSKGSLIQCSCGSIPEEPPNGQFSWGGCSDNVQFGEKFAAYFGYGIKKVDNVQKPSTQQLRSSNKRIKNYRRTKRNVYSAHEYKVHKRRKKYKSGRNRKRERRKKKRKKRNEIDKMNRRIISLMNQHNGEVGQKVARISIKRSCKCHGVSGSCTMKTCWEAMESFYKIGERLKMRYDAGVEVQPMKVANKLRLMPASSAIPRFSSDDLVYVTKSPDYCRPNKALGSYGTHGRTCNATSAGIDNCDVMCCGRGHTSQLELVKRRCNCRYHWCCYVSCETCSSWETKNTCH